MIDLIQAQDDIFGILMSSPQLATVNIVEERKSLLNSEIQIDTIWQTVRNGCSGNGLLIEIPGILCDSESVTGPPQQVELSFVSFQNGDAAFIPRSGNAPAGVPVAGSGLFAEQIEQYLVDILHLLNISGIGTMRVAGRFSSPAREYAGVNARRTRIVMTPRQTAQTPRTAIVTVAVNGGLATLACATAGAAIYYTVDGSFPSNPTAAIDPVKNVPINGNSRLYTAPFAVTAGQVIRAAAYLSGSNPGPIARFQN
ncbi:MAG TPA: chitobiase/beta-hexosaminidase C-terminal domain-containing protein [Candidatus Acidoferrum sp.]|nr:chitobiase/beta-hexosaminidase C-terminal domain-containing protein [Candidatus Acidoferrum sp.]